MNDVTQVSVDQRPVLRTAAARARLQSPVRRLVSFEGLTRPQIVVRLTFFSMLLSVLVISPIVIRNALTWVDTPFAGFLVNPRMVVGTVGQYHWPGREAGLTNPDRILMANGRAISSISDLQAMVRATPLGEPVSYRVQRGKETAEIRVPTMRFTWADLVMTFGVTFLSGLAYLLIAVVVYLLKPDHEASFAFLIACFLLSVYMIVSFDVFSTHWGFIRLYIFTGAFMPAAFVHLSLVFPEKRGFARRYRYILIAPYLVAALLAIPYELFYPGPAFLLFARLTRLYAVAGALALLASTLYTCFGKSSALARQRAKVVLLGASLAFPLPAIARSSALVGGTFLGLSLQTNFLALPLVIFPASIAWAIARHNLFDVDVYIKRAVGYGTMTALVATSYASLQVILRSVLAPVFGEQVDAVYPIFFALLIVFLFNPVNHRVQDTVDRLFFRKKFDYKQTISAVSDALTSMLRLDQILDQVIRTVQREMFVETAAVVVVAEPGKGAAEAFVAGNGIGQAHRELKRIPIGDDDALLVLISERKDVLTKYDLEEDPRYEALRTAGLQRFEEIGGTVALPLLYQGEVRGALVLGDKKSGNFYSRDDIDLLATMANQAAIAIQNAITHEEVVRYAEELAVSLRRIQILESIKTNLAKFVPRTVQQLIEESPEAPSLEKREADVSVLFADISGYTRLSAQLELDQVNRLVERYFGAFLDEILRNGGDVNETAGDGLMVIFQDPDPPRHARAAATTALAIRRRTLEINEELTGRFEPIAMHVGVNSGVAAVGATKIEGVAGTRWTFTASGPTTNVAARLASLATGGVVVISEETRRRLGDDFVLEDLGPQSFKNVERPIRAYRLMGEKAAQQVAEFPAERRQYPRRPVSWRVRLWVGEESFTGQVLDASIHGLGVVSGSAGPLEVGKSYRLEILDGGARELRFVGRVRRVTERGIGIETEEPLPLGE